MVHKELVNSFVDISISSSSNRRSCTAAEQLEPAKLSPRSVISSCPPTQTEYTDKYERHLSDSKVAGNSGFDDESIASELSHSLDNVDISEPEKVMTGAATHSLKNDLRHGPSLIKCQHHS